MKIHARVISVVVLALIAGAISVYFLASKDQPAGTKRSEKISSAGVVEPAGATTPRIAARPALLASGASPVNSSLARDNPYWSEMAASNFTAAFKRLATIDDPAAAMTAYEISLYCTLYADPIYPKTLAKIDAGQEKPEVKAKQRMAAEKQRARCVGFGFDDINKANERFRYVHEKGDPRGVAFNMPLAGTSIADRIASAQAAAQLKDPLAIKEVGAFFMRRQDVAGGSVATFDMGDGTQVSRRILYDAFQLAACSYGDDCGAGNVYVAARCVNMGRCDAMNLQDAFIHYNYSPADTERLLAAHRMVLNGLNTGQWPSRFWTSSVK